MITLPKVFVASSSEGLGVANEVQKLLQQALSGMVAVSVWNREFKLTKVYIESLERLLDTSDFAVMVLTPDDRTTSREAEKASPRDNVVFELGLFFGRLGRERCFIIQPRDLDLKLPSDLLGIESAYFSMGQELEAALNPACSLIGKAICDATVALPSRPKLGDAERAAQADMRRLADRITGTWWERIQFKQEVPALSFFTIELDDVHSSVRLDGKAYGPDGMHVANWRSAAARLDGKKIIYVRECERLDAGGTPWLPGLGEINFHDSTDIIKHGNGKFWESDESRPEETVIKHVELKRNSNDRDAFTMQEGIRKERAALVKKILGKW